MTNQLNANRIMLEYSSSVFQFHNLILHNILVKQRNADLSFK